MKKLIYGGLFLALVGIGFVGCKKDKIASERVNVENKKDNSPLTKGFTNEDKNKSAFINPYDENGKIVFNFLKYVDQYSKDISDSAVFCQEKYEQTGIKDYTTKTKFLYRIKEFGRMNGKSINYDSLSSLYSNFKSYTTEDLSRLVNEGKISQDFQNVLLDFNKQLKLESTCTGVINISLLSAEKLSKSSLSLKDGELKKLYIIMSGVGYTAKYLLSKGQNNLPVGTICMNMPCPVAEVGYAASFVGLCMATGPVGWVVGGIGFACGVWGVFDAC